MIKASELRLGNYFIDNNNNIVEIESIWGKLMVSFNTLSDRTLSTRFPTKHLKPIELTEEWLFKFGFKKVSIPTSMKGFYINYYEKDNFIVYLLKDSFEVELITKSTGYEQFNLFKNFKKEVHILQNLHFLLENVELDLSSNN